MKLSTTLWTLRSALMDAVPKPLRMPFLWPVFLSVAIMHAVDHESHLQEFGPSVWTSLEVVMIAAELIYVAILLLSYIRPPELDTPARSR